MGRSRSRTFSRSRSGSVVSARNGVSASRSRSRSRSCRRSRSASKEKRRVRSASRDRYKKRRDHSRSRSRSPYRGGRGRYSGRGGSKYGSSRDNPDPNRCLGVFNLSLYTTEQDLRRIFDEFGDLEKIDLIYDHPTGRSRGFAFITYKSLDDAITARDKMIGCDIDGHRIRIDFSVTKRAHSPTPGQYMGAFRGRGRGGRRGYRSDRGYGGMNRSPSPRYSRGSPRRRSRSPYARRSRSRSPRY